MLTERRKADRAVMAAAVAALAAECGATATIEPMPLNPRGMFVRIEAPGGLSVAPDFDGYSRQPDVYVVSWYLPCSGRRLSEDFLASVNPYHRRKATAVVYDFESLCAHLRAGLAMARDGSAYQERN